ncbi:MAG: hypothetical protein AMXMBFR56_41300 [Polyangiaceae bacterium]
MFCRARQLRVEQNLTIDEVARRTEVDRSRISRFERGYLRLRLDELRRIAGVLEVTIEQLTEPAAAGPQNT